MANTAKQYKYEKHKVKKKKKKNNRTNVTGVCEAGMGRVIFSEQMAMNRFRKQYRYHLGERQHESLRLGARLTLAR